jgi:uncharacterized membrane protein
LLVFWPVVALLVLAFWNRERRSLMFCLVALWSFQLGFTEFFYNDDLYGESVNRFNTCLKWWGWVFAGATLSLGALNLSSKSKICRYGSAVILFSSLLFAIPLGWEFLLTKKPSLGKMEGSGWLETDPVIKDIITVLASRPDGIALQSGLERFNTPSPGVALFGRKQSLLGWPWHETTWRGVLPEIEQRRQQIEQFYQGKMESPLAWLLQNDVRYILWLPQDNPEANKNFRPLMEQIKSHYGWHAFYGNDHDFAVGFWERNSFSDSR